MKQRKTGSQPTPEKAAHKDKKQGAEGGKSSAIIALFGIFVSIAAIGATTLVFSRQVSPSSSASPLATTSSTELPEGWTTDETGGILPPGWKRHVEESGQQYFHNRELGLSRWDRPEKPVLTAKDSHKEYLRELDELQAMKSRTANQTERMNLLAAMQALSKLKQHELPTPQSLEWRVVSESPRIYMMDNFLSPEECEFIKSQVKGRMEPAMVVQQTDNKYDLQTQLRNNDQVWLSQIEEKNTPILAHILKRIHRHAHVPEEDAEALQVGHYDEGEKYELHIDTDPEHDVARPATMIIYLQDVTSGGQTIYPITDENRQQCKSQYHPGKDGGEKVFGVRNCCEPDSPGGGGKGLVRVAAKRGRAVLFFNHKLDGNKDSKAEHAACPILEGDKWLVQRWFRFKPHQNILHRPEPRFNGVPLLDKTVPEGDLAPGYLEHRVLSNKAPRIYLIDDFLTPEEITHLLTLPGSLDVAESVEGAFTRRWVPGETEVQDSVLSAVAKRMYRVARVSEGHAEPLQFGRAEPGGQLQIHVDSDPRRGSVRPLSLVIYLDGDGTEGHEGATFFPLGRCKDIEDCCTKTAVNDLKGPIIVPPKAGRALLIGSHNVQGQLETESAHGSCPAGSAGKTVLQRWFRTELFMHGVTHPKDPRFDGLDRLDEL